MFIQFNLFKGKPLSIIKMRGTHSRKFNVLSSVTEILSHIDTHAANTPHSLGVNTSLRICERSMTVSGVFFHLGVS